MIKEVGSILALSFGIVVLLFTVINGYDSIGWIISGCLSTVAIFTGVALLTERNDKK